MPKRLLWFLVSLAVVLLFTIVVPMLNRASEESNSVNTSVSVAPNGYKGLFLLLAEVSGQPVRFWQHSMMNLQAAGESKSPVVWLIEPGQGLFFDGKAYGNRMRKLAENGSHLIFVFNAIPSGEAKTMAEALAYLNRWYGMKLKTRTLKGIEPDNLHVRSHFAGRAISRLVYGDLTQTAARKFGWQRRASSIEAFVPNSLGQARILLETDNGEPLLVRSDVGRGSVTVFLDGFYFDNGQLDHADNAALAVALQEQFPGKPVLFEVYSNGFNENRDFITYLATGKGVAFLITLFLMLIAFCLWIMQQPPRRREEPPSRVTQAFTQEVFIGALAEHYLETRNWQALYEHLLGQLRREIDRRYPGLPLETQRAHVAANPFYGITPAELDAVFGKIILDSESAFVRQGRRLLAVQRKLQRKATPYEHAIPVARHARTVATD